MMIVGRIAPVVFGILMLYGYITTAAQEPDNDILDLLPGIIAASTSGVTTKNGWFVKSGRDIWGNCQHNGWWRTNRASVVRKANTVGPNRTEDIPRLVKNMLQHGYPCFEHTLPLWHDRRRDAHDTNCRSNNNIVGPTLAFPWKRSATGTACDGGSDYDLTGFNPWYFQRLEEMAEESRRKGTIFIVNLYMQHALLERTPHYVDFPWRPGNSRQSTGMPSDTPAANAFYTSRFDLHRLYIRKTLNTLKPYSGTIISLSGEYTGPLSFMRFFIDTVKQWESENQRKVHLSIGATKDVLDAILADPQRSPSVDTIDLRYFWYLSNGSLNAPKGGREVPGRYALGKDSVKTSPGQIYRQVLQYRTAYSGKAILHHIEASREQTIAFLMAGGSALIRYLQYSSDSPSSYIAPADSYIIRPVYALINRHLQNSLHRMAPKNIISGASTTTWALGSSHPDMAIYLIYNQGGQFSANLRPGSYRVRWFNADSAALISTSSSLGGRRSFAAPGNGHYFLIAD